MADHFVNRLRAAGVVAGDGNPFPSAAELKRARLATGKQNKKCVACGLMCHPIRTACPRCKGEVQLHVPDPDLTSPVDPDQQGERA